MLLRSTVALAVRAIVDVLVLGAAFTATAADHSDRIDIEHARQDDGLCLACGSLETSGVEPDAEEYECCECGASAVQGLENALCDGHIAIEGD